MKKLTFWKSLFLLFALIVGSTSAWATDETVSFIFTGNNSNCTAVSGSVGGIYYATGKTGSATATAYNTTNGLVLYGVSDGGGYFNTTTAIDGSITNISVTTNNKKNSPKYKVYGSDNGSDWTQIGSETSGGDTESFDTSDGYTYIKIANTTAATAQLGINSIIITYSPADKTPTTTTINASGITNTDVYVSPSAGSLSANVTFTEGGATVSGASVSWKSSNENVATVASNGAVTLKKKGVTTITATYAGNDDYMGSNDTYVLNVTSSAPQATEISVTTDYEWLDVSSGSNIAAANLPKIIDCDGLTITFGTGGSSKPRGDASYIRFYTDNSMTFTAPANHFIKSIEMTRSTASGAKWDNSITVDKGTWDNDTKTWTCEEDDISKNISEVTLTSGGQKWISQIDITLVPYVTIPASGYLSYCDARKLDFSETNVKAYKAKVENDKVVLTQVNVVPAEEGVVLFSSEAKTAKEAKNYTIPVTDKAASDVTGNQMKGVLARTQVVWNPETNVYNYILQQGNFNKATDGYLKANRAYLSTNYNVTANGARPLTIVFEGETTGINGVEEIAPVTKTRKVVKNGRLVIETANGEFTIDGARVK